MQTVGIDIGYGFLKVTNGKETFVIPSVVGNAIDLSFEIQGQKKDLSNLTIELDGQKYFVGDMAILQSEHPYRSLSTDRTTDIVTKILFLTGLALFMKEPVESFTVVTGLPVKDYSLYKNIYTDSFVGTFSIYLNGEKRIIHIKKVVVVVQPFGTFCDSLFMEDGSVDEEFAQDHVGIIDIGYKTSDFIQVKNYRYLEKYSSTSANGISSIYKDVANYLSSHYSIYKEDYELEDIIHNGYIKTRKGLIDLKNVIEESKHNLARKIVNEIKSIWTNLPEINIIIVSGGGGALLYNDFVSLLGEDVVLNPNPQISNVRGYKYWGDFLLSNN